jgi:uncharacterized Zn finger protein
MTPCSACTEDLDGCEEVMNNGSHRWIRCFHCGKTNTLRVQEIRGSRHVDGVVETGTEFKGEIDV